MIFFHGQEASEIALWLQECVNYGLGVEIAQVAVSLASSHKHDWLARGVCHGDGSADLQVKPTTCTCHQNW